MLGLSYNLSPTLKDNLQKIESYRRQILLNPLSPKAELRLRWEAMLNRIYWSLTLSDNPLTKAEMVKLSTTQTKKRLTPTELEVINYKKGLDYIAQNWMVTRGIITPKTILTLHNIVSGGRFRGSESELKQVLEYLQVSSENPVVQAGIAQIQLVTLSPFTDGNGRTARLLALLFLYRAGFDFRGLLVLEEYFRRDLASFQQATQSVSKNENLTLWLEYFAQGVVLQLEKMLENLTLQRSHLDLPASFWELNDRQKDILTTLEQPGATITNKKAQKQFRVSQITASRDLSQLNNLGLIFARGKGRSIYYTKV